MATYGCNAGYALAGGDNVTTCNSTGAWSGTPPTCQGNNYDIKNMKKIAKNKCVFSYFGLLVFQLSLVMD